jgi:hypothetical protein
VSTHTPGPWFADPHGKVWRRPLHELYEYGGGTAGDKPLATVERGWYGEGLVGYPMEANARLIAAAPELLEALKVLVEAAEFSPLLCGFDALDRAHAAIAKAEEVKP